MQPEFTTPKDQASSACDIVIDLVSDESILAAEATRDGYLRAPNADPLKLSLIGAQAKALVGTFDKPLYVKYEGSICAHLRDRRRPAVPDVSTRVEQRRFGLTETVSTLILICVAAVAAVPPCVPPEQSCMTIRHLNLWSPG